MDESQVRAALFVWLEKESGRNGGVGIIYSASQVYGHRQRIMRPSSQIVAILHFRT